MATNYYNAQIGVVDASGNVNVIYPITKATNVDVTSKVYGTGNATTVLQTALDNIVSALGSKAPTSHASTATTYGVGNASNYGHIKLTDTYSSVSTSQKAANSIGASAWALQTVYNKMPTSNCNSYDYNLSYTYLDGYSFKAIHDTRFISNVNWDYPYTYGQSYGISFPYLGYQLSSQNLYESLFIYALTPKFMNGTGLFIYLFNMSSSGIDIQSDTLTLYFQVK